MVIYTHKHTGHNTNTGPSMPPHVWLQAASLLRPNWVDSWDIWSALHDNGDPLWSLSRQLKELAEGLCSSICLSYCQQHTLLNTRAHISVWVTCIYVDLCVRMKVCVLLVRRAAVWQQRWQEGGQRPHSRREGGSEGAGGNTVTCSLGGALTGHFHKPGHWLRYIFKAGLHSLSFVFSL